MRTRRFSATALAACVLLIVDASAQLDAQPAKRPITHHVYDAWNAIQGTALSRDGVWLAYALVPQDGDGELVVRNLRTRAERRHPRGSAPQFTPDGRFVAFAIAPLKAAVDAAKKARKKDDDLPKSGFGVMTLATGQVFSSDRVKNFKIPEESSGTVAYLVEPSEAEQKEAKDVAEKSDDEDGKKKRKKEPGTDLIVRNLESGASDTIPGVTEYVWAEDGAWLAYAVSTRTGGSDGAYVRNTRTGATTSLLTGQGVYKSLAVDEAGRQLAFVSDRDEHPKDPDTANFKLYHWSAGADSAARLAEPRTTGMPERFSVSEHAKLAFSKDGTAIFLGLAPATPPRPDGAPDPIKVDLWHYRDPFLQSMQRVRADDESKRSYLAVLHLKDRRLVALGSPDLPELTVTEGVDALLGGSDVPYRQLVSWDGEYSDYYLVSARDGVRRRIVEKARFGASLSPGGKYAIYYDVEGQDWISVRAADGRRTNLTDALAPKFDDEDEDTPGPARPYGVAGWLPDDKAVLLYDRYDIWEISPEGSSARNATGGAGREARITFRYLRTDPEEKAIASGRPLLLSAVDERTKRSGFYRLDPSSGAGPVKLLMLDKALGNLQKARNADVFVFTASRFDEFPDLWVSGPRFTDAKKVTQGNPQQTQFVWGTAELIDYRNADGRPLRAILVKPENFDPARRYPLMVYIYEQLSDNLHRYVPPAPGHSINVTRYVSNGYVVLMPDIVYDEGYSGASAYKCVIPAVQTVTAMGFVDPSRIGIQGHSWGGYQITYLVTRTNMFRAVEAGASVANMISAYGGIRWETGMSRAFQYEKTQSRIGGPPWELTTRYIENSPIFWVDRVQTPYLTMHNDDDGAVPWYQGIEFFTALRRLGKEAYLFNYNGEKHGLRQRENQKHFTVHMAEFFDHYLLGAPRPEWMDKGVPYLERGTRDLTEFYRRKATDR